MIFSLKKDRIIEAQILITDTHKALEGGLLHYRKSDMKLLTNAKEIIGTLLDEGEVIITKTLPERTK